MAEEMLSIVELDTNLGDVERPPEVPKGRYVGEVNEVQEAVSAGKGNRYYSVKFIIPPSELPADIQEHYPEGAVLYWNRQLVPKSGDRRTMYNLKQFYMALGLDPNITVVDPNEWMGRQASLVIVEDTYQGEPRSQIRAVEPVEGEAEAAPAAKAAPARGRRR